MLRFTRWILVLVMLLPTLSYANYYWDGNKLKTLVDADDRVESGKYTRADSGDSDLLLGYIVGVVDADEDRFCIPDGIQVGQLVGLVKKYVRDNPRFWHFPANILVSSAIVLTFPCKKK